MNRAVILLVVASLVLSACGWRESRLNPGNWFGRSKSVPVEATAEDVNPLIPTRSPLFSRKSDDLPDLHVPIQQITALVIERTQSGAIIRAEGVAARQGAYSARLSNKSEDGGAVDGVLEYTFEVLYPERPRPVGSTASRKVVVARSLTTQGLAGVRTIRVVGAENAREARRR